VDWLASHLPSTIVGVLYLFGHYHNLISHMSTATCGKAPCIDYLYEGSSPSNLIDNFMHFGGKPRWHTERLENLNVCKGGEY
jgi:hypothetical protein